MSGLRRDVAAIVAAAVAVVVVAAFSLSVVVTVWTALFSDHDAPVSAFTAALQTDLAVVEPGDRVLVHPPWRDDVVTAVAALPLPKGVVVSEAFAPRHGDVWPNLVVVADRRWPLPAVIEKRPGANVVKDHGDVVVFRIGGSQSGGRAVRATANDAIAASPFALENAHVFVVESDGRTVECPWNDARGRHICTGLPPWMTVGEDTLTIDGQQSRCFWSHPRTGATLVVDYGAVAVAGTVAAAVALSDGAVANDNGAAVTARLVVGDRAASVTVHRERGFHDAVVDGPAGTVPVRLEFTTKDDGQRHTCFRLTTTATPTSTQTETP